MALRGNGPEWLARRRQGQDWRVGAGKWAWSTATEAVFGWIERAIRIGWSLEVR